MTKRVSATGVRGVYQQGDKYVAYISGVVKRTVPYRMPQSEKLKKKAMQRIEDRESRDSVVEIRSDHTNETIVRYYRKTFLGSFHTLDEARAAYDTEVRNKEARKEEERERKRQMKEEAREERLDRRAGLPVGVVRRINMRGESFHAYITINRRCKYLGAYETVEEASAAYIAAKQAQNAPCDS
jgi:hypothetical protein